MDNKVCRRCLLGDNIQGIKIDRDGLCNICRTSRTKELSDKLKTKYERKFIEHTKQYRDKSTYDCIVAYSGGKDSTYTLHLLKEKYHLKPLALTFDNWFQSPGAHENIRKVISQINVDHITVRPGFKTFKQMITACIEKDVYPVKTMQRASAICTICLSMIRFICFRYAIEQNIPFVVFGLSPGQAPEVTSVFKTNPDMVKSMQDFVFEPIKENVGMDCAAYFLEQKHYNRRESFPYSINPLAFSEYNETEIYSVIKKLGWEKPCDTDANSTNCLLNGFANHIHEKHYGFNPYIFEVSYMVREGCFSREEGFKRMEEPPDDEMITKVYKILDMDAS